MKLFQFEREPFKNLRATEKMALKQTRKKGVQIGSNSKNKLEQEKGNFSESPNTRGRSYQHF